MERCAPFFNSDAREIILRAERAVAIECAAQRYFITDHGSLTALYQPDGLLSASVSDIAAVFKSICDYSVYARQNELNRGYITIENGVRVGICGTAVESEGRIVNIKDITTLSFRAASEILGCADELLERIKPLDGALICGPPCSGKTTVIRDMARQLSFPYKVAVIDERGEIAASSQGKCGYDIGLSDVLNGVRKGEGMILSLRSLSPDIILCDELGDNDDAGALRYALRCGASVIATVHARTLSDLRARPMTADLLNSGAFRFLVFLGDRRHAGQVGKIYELRDVCH